MNNERIAEMETLIRILAKASHAYYVDDEPIMTDHEYDTLFDQLTTLEQSTGITLASSPTQKVRPKTSKMCWILRGMTPKGCLFPHGRWTA